MIDTSGDAGLSLAALAAAMLALARCVRWILILGASGFSGSFTAAPSCLLGTEAACTCTDASHSAVRMCACTQACAVTGWANNSM